MFIQHTYTIIVQLKSNNLLCFVSGWLPQLCGIECKVHIETESQEDILFHSRIVQVDAEEWNRQRDALKCRSSKLDYYLLCIHTRRKGSCWCAGVCTVHMSHSHWCRESGMHACTPRLWHWCTAQICRKKKEIRGRTLRWAMYRRYDWWIKLLVYCCQGRNCRICFTFKMDFNWHVLHSSYSAFYLWVAAFSVDTRRDSISLLFCSSLWSILTHLNNSWMWLPWNFWTDIHVPQRMNPTNFLLPRHYVDICESSWNVSTTIGWITLKYCTDTLVPQMMNPTNSRLLLSRHYDVDICGSSWICLNDYIGRIAMILLLIFISSRLLTFW